jgi:predicted nucleotidyltransferase
LQECSHPTIIEWLVTDIVYYGSQNAVFKEFALKNFSKVSLYHHYKAMCRNNYLKYLKSRSLVTYKKYLYAYRGLVNAKWVVHNGSVPPIRFTEALEAMKGILPANVLDKLAGIIRLKSEGREKQVIPNIVMMDSYIEDFLRDDSEAPRGKSYAALTDLNREIRRIVIG